MISYDEMTQRLNELSSGVSSAENAIYIEINLLHLELIKKAGEKDFDTTILEKVEKLFKRIDVEIPIGNTKHLQKVFLAEIAARVLGRILLDFLVDDKINESAGLITNSKYKIQVHHKITTLNSKCHSIFIDALRFSEENKDDLLLAHAHLNLALLLYGDYFALFLADHTPHEDLTESFREMIRSSVIAYNQFIVHGLEPFAFNALILTKEIHTLAKRWLNFDIEDVIRISEIDQKIEWLNENGYSKPFESVVENAYQRKKEIFAKNENEIADQLTPEDIESIALVQMRSLGLSKDRYENIIEDIKASEIFRKRCKNPDLVVASDQKKTGRDAYASKPKFAVFSRKSGMLYVEGYDIDKILTRLGF